MRGSAEMRSRFYLKNRMAKRTTRQANAPKECKDCDRWKQMKEKIRIAQLLEVAITKMEAKLETDDFKPTVGDFLKLMQLEQELAQDEAKEIKVTWVEPAATTPEK